MNMWRPSRCLSENIEGLNGILLLTNLIYIFFLVRTNLIYSLAFIQTMFIIVPYNSIKLHKNILNFITI